MCKKTLIVWDCKHTEEEDPRRWPLAQERKRNCNGYAFAWAMRESERDPRQTKCPDCILAEEAETRRRLNQAFLDSSSAHPILRIVSTVGAGGTIWRGDCSSHGKRRAFPISD